MNFLNKKILKKSWLVLIVPFFITACSSNNNFVFANFQSYISDDLLNQIEAGVNVDLYIDNEASDIKINSLTYRTYNTNEDLERNFVNNYDLAVASTYLVIKYANSGIVDVVDWSKFNLYDDDNNLITNSYDALSLFSQRVQDELLIYNDLLQPAFENDKDNENLNVNGGLLNYCIPYFLQEVILGYNFESTYFDNNNPLDWNQTIGELAKIANDSHFNRIAIVDDYATIYGVSKLIESENKTVNPIENGDFSINNAKTTFSYLFDNQIDSNKYLFNSDSNILLNDFAADYSNAIISYNGDLLYAFQGGDNYTVSTDEDSFLNWLANHFNNKLLFNYLKPNPTLAVMDCIIINKSRTNKLNNVNKAYALVKKVGLEGSDQLEINLLDENDEYVYGPMVNFDYVNYVTPLNNLNEYVLSGLYFDDIYSEYEDQIKQINTNLYEDFINLLINTYQINDLDKNNVDLLARSFSDLEKSNISWAWTITKNNL